MNYQGDFLEDATVYIVFNTFDSNDPSASVTITDLAQGDVEIWKDGVVQTTPGSGVTLTLNIGTGNGTHLIAVDTSDNTDAGWFATGFDYQARITGTTVDGATVNAWVGSFSIENRFTEVNVTAMAAGVIANATFNADVGSTAHGTNIIALAVRKILEELNLDHLLKVDTTIAADGDLEDYVVAGTVLAHVMSANKDVTGYKCTTDSLEANKVHADTIKAETALIVADTNELQTDNYPVSIAALQTDLDTITDTGVNTVSLSNNAITAASINADAITEAKIADNAIAAEHLATGAIVAATFAANAITSTVVADNTITAAKLNGDCITNAKIADDAIAAENLATGAIAADAVAATALDNVVMSDLAGIPAAAASIVDGVSILFMALKNKQTATSIAQTIANDAGATIATAVLSDVTGTTTKAEYA